MPELLRPFSRIHVLGLALLGCLALGVLSGEWLWVYLGLGGAAVGALWAGVLLYRDLRRPPS